MSAVDRVLAATVCAECGDALGDEPTLPAAEPGWRVHVPCADVCARCTGTLEAGRWPGVAGDGSLCGPCHFAIAAAMDR